MNYLLSLVTFFPLVGVVIILFLRDENKATIRWTALIVSLVTFILSLVVLSRFNPAQPGLQLEDNFPWVAIAGWLVSYHLGVDGIQHPAPPPDHFPLPNRHSFHLGFDQRPRARLYDLFPPPSNRDDRGIFSPGPGAILHFLGIYPRPDVFSNRHLGVRGPSVCLLQVLPLHHGRLDAPPAGDHLAGGSAGTFSLPELTARGGLSYPAQSWLFLAFAVAFAVKVPLWPLHSWLPDAHVEAPTAGSVILAG